MPRSSSPKTTTRTSAKSVHHRGHTKLSDMDTLELLIHDHEKVQKMFEQFSKMEEDQDQEAKQLLVEEACAELTLHARLEEELFYPVLREAIEESDLLDEAAVEHDVAKQLMTELAAMQPDDDLYDAKFTVLGEYITHHIQEEEKRIFPKAKKAKIDLEGIADEIRKRKIELRDELGMQPYNEEEEEEEEEKSRSHAKSHRPLH
jgi:hemerythrin superfamily protein